uniref:Uncharacterized protein n=1 Tax=Anguilla anguilla TaxID=7936 RepID=A0A0E9W1H6_ANGAN
MWLILALACMLESLRINSRQKLSFSFKLSGSDAASTSASYENKAFGLAFSMACKYASSFKTACVIH